MPSRALRPAQPGRPSGSSLPGGRHFKALAVDSIFVFLMVFTYFAVPAEYQKRVLVIGILGAIVLRANRETTGDGESR